MTQSGQLAASVMRFPLRLVPACMLYRAMHPVPPDGAGAHMVQEQDKQYVAWVWSQLAVLDVVRVLS